MALIQLTNLVLDVSVVAVFPLSIMPVSSMYSLARLIASASSRS